MRAQRLYFLAAVEGVRYDVFPWEMLDDGVAAVTAAVPMYDSGGAALGEGIPAAICTLPAVEVALAALVVFFLQIPKSRVPRHAPVNVQGSALAVGATG